MYLIGGLRYNVPHLYNEYKGEVSFERSTLKLKEELTANAVKYKNKNSLPDKGVRGHQSDIDSKALQVYLTEVVFVDDSPDEITRSELQMQLLKVIGVVTENFRDRLFNLIDDDKSGIISIDELVEFLQNWSPTASGIQRFICVTKEAFTDVGWILSLGASPKFHHQSSQYHSSHFVSTSTPVG